MKPLTVAFLALLVAMTAFAEPPAQHQFREATPIGPDEGFPSEFAFTVGQWSCRITPEGKANCVSGPRKWRFAVPTEDGGIERLFTSGDDPVVLAYQLSTGEASWGTVVGITPGARKQKWVASISDMNLVAPIERDGSVFVAALAFVASIDSTDGHFIWLHKCVYDGSRREATEITLTADTVIVKLFDDSRPTDQRLTCYNAATGAFVACPGV